MSADAIGLAMVDGAHVQVYSFQTTKGALHTRQALIIAHGLLAGHRFGGDVSANDINAMQRFFLLDIGVFARISEAVVFDLNLKMLSHFIAVQYLAGAQSD